MVLRLRERRNPLARYSEGFLSSYAYLASPYSHPDKKVKEGRYLAACKAAAELMLRGKRVFSPIAHSHPIEVHGMTELMDGTFWMKQDGPLLVHASELIVLMLNGWEESKGVQEEIRICTLINKPISYMEWDGIDPSGSAAPSPR